MGNDPEGGVDPSPPSCINKTILFRLIPRRILGMTESKFKPLPFFGGAHRQTFAGWIGNGPDASQGSRF
jgi:hypothetical protein